MSKLTQVVTLLYSMQDADTRALEADLLAQRKQVWGTTMQALARSQSCNKAPQAPRRQDLETLRRMSKQDSKSITRTYNRELKNEVERLFKENPRGNRNFYFRRLEAWIERRNGYKLPQIALNTNVTTTEYARARFREENFGAGLRYLFSGPPATCDDCSEHFGAGVVDQSYVDAHPCPRHINCPHYWRAVNVPKVACAELWVGG